MEYPMCTLSDIIDPGKYSVISTDKEHVLEVLTVEKNMKKEMSYRSSEFELCCQMCVAVISTEGTFKRGVIEKKLGDDFFQVLLIDSGCIVHVEKSKIKVITNQDFMKVEPLAFTVRLYGLIPVKYVYEETVRKPRALKDWCVESKVFVQNLLQQNHKVVVQSILIQQRTVYGDLFIQSQPKAKFKSLRKILCKKEFCVYSESNFLRQEGLDQSTGSVELKTKMELVEKWRRENFVEQKRSFQLPKPALFSNSNSNSTKTDFSFSRSTSNSFSQLPKELSETSGSRTETPKAAPADIRALGTGRGKIKLLIAEMKEKQRALAAANVDDGSHQIHSTGRPETNVTLGRGQLLKQYFKIKNSLKSTTDISLDSDSVTGTVTKKITSDRFSDVEKQSEERKKQEINLPTDVFKMEKAIVKPGEFCELNESNEMTEVSLSNEELPSLVRNVKVEKEWGRKKLSGDKYGGGDELNKSNLDINMKTMDENFEEKGLCVMEGTVSSESCPKYWTVENSLKQSAKALLKSCWTPYVLFDDCVVEPVKSFNELRIQRDVIKNLRKGGAFDCLSQVQSWMIPSIRRQLNTIVIGSSKTGKTLGYVVPLMDFIQDGSYFEELPQGNGPSLVIVASSSRTCESIYNLCCSLTGRCKIRIVLAHGGGREKEVWVELTNGCDVLISTPHCLVRLLESSILTNFERLTCLVLDEIDVISQKPFRKNVRVILEKAQFSTKNRHYQKILCGEKWTDEVANIAKTYVESYALVIGSYSEAVVYKGLKPRIHIVDKREKAEVLLNKLKEFKELKVVVVCEKASEVKFLHDFLLKEGLTLSIVAHENLMADELPDVRELWNTLGSSILIATDGVLNELDIREAQVLIHYSLPCKSKTNFYLRYFTLKDFLREKKSCKTKSKSPKKELLDIILIDDENHYQLPHIVDFVKRLKGKLPENVLEKCLEIRRLIEVEKCNFPICSNVLSFGRCRNVLDCPRRHAFVKAWDSAGNLPTAGWLNFVVLKTHDASCFSVRLVECIDADGKTSKSDYRHLELPVKMSEFFKMENDRKAHGMPKVGDVCAVLHEEVFFRAEIIEFSRTDKHGKPSEVNVRLLDRGDVLTRKNSQLYELPEELSRYPPVAVDVRMVGLEPLDCDAGWSQTANEFTDRLMTGELEENQYWTGKIVLALKNTLFLNPIKRKQFLPHLNSHVVDLVVRKELLNNRIAVANDLHLEALEKLCSDGGLEIRTVEETRTEPSAIRPQWAFFDEDFIRVRFLSAENASTIFLQPKKFDKLLQKLEEDCQKEAAEARTGKSRTIGVGAFCLALFENGNWNRARIESEENNKFHVYFIDHGDFLFVAKSDVVPISKSLLLRLPCQAIECKLAGIEEVKERSEDILREIYNFSENGKAYVYAYVVRKDLTASITGGRKYSLNLVNKKGVSLNKLLVECGMVRLEESERKHLKDIQVNASDDDGDDEEEDDRGDIAEEGKEKDSDLMLFENYFENLSDEEVDGFLKEFASTFADLFEHSQQESQISGGENKKDVRHISPTNPSEDAEAEKSKLIPEAVKPEEKENSSETKLELNLKGRENVLTPQVLWCQNQLEVQIKIQLGNVQDYSLECTVNNISFRCFSGDKFYAMDLRLYGAIDPESTKISLKAFHALVVLTKLAYPLWPRLHADEGRLRWINLDVESLGVKDEIFSDRIRSAKLEIESGMVKKGIRSETILPCSESGDSDDGEMVTDSEESEDKY